MKDRLIILNLEDNRNDADLNQETLSGEGIESEMLCVETRDELLAALQKGKIDLILADHTLPSFDGLSALELANAQRPDIPFIFVTGTLNEEMAIEAMKKGATDYVLKDKLSRLAPAVRRALKEKEERKERVRAEEALLVKNHAIESAINAIAIFDLEGGITYVNPSFLTTWQYDNAEEVLQRPLADFLQAPGDARTMAKTLRADGNWIGELVARRKTGQLFDVQVSASMVRSEKGKPLCLMASFLDISEKKHTEARLRQAQKMEAIGTLAGGIAHDFNNILSPIIGYAEMALEELEGETALRDELRQILNAGYRARDLVKQILSFSRHKEQEKRPLRASLVVKEALSLLRASLPTTIEIRQKISPDGISSNILGDPTQMQQVVMNLCTNAAHAMREKGGILEVGLEDVHLDSSSAAGHPGIEPGPYLRLWVSDTGHGMTDEVRQRIFEPYFTTKGKGEGTGLGLATAYGIVKSHGGAISVNSRPTRGTVFHIFLPRIENVTDHLKASRAKAPKGGDESSLVDDEETMVAMESKMLQHLGYEVVATSNSMDALEAFRNEPDAFDIVVTDQTMPHMTGADLSREILKMRPTVPIVLCTGFSDVIDEEKARAIGIRQLLMKPVMMAEMAEALRELLA